MRVCVSLGETALAPLLLAAIPAAAADVSSRPTGDIHRRMTDEAAQCLAEKGAPVVAAWLNTLPGSAGESQLVSRNEMLLMRCLRTTTAGMLSWAADYDYPAVRARLVQYVVKNEIVALPAVNPPGLARPAWFAGAGRGALPADSIIANDLGFCLAKTNWPVVRAAVLAEPGSAKEAGHLRALVPLVGGCIPPGAKLRMDLPRLRAVLDENGLPRGGRRERRSAGTSAGRPAAETARSWAEEARRGVNPRRRSCRA